MGGARSCARYPSAVLPREKRWVSGAKTRAPPILRSLKPRDHFLGVLVRREYRIEHLADDAVVDHQRHALVQRHAGDREGRELDRAREREAFIGKNGERQMQALRRLALVSAVLRREAEKVGNAELLELGEMVAE